MLYIKPREIFPAFLVILLTGVTIIHIPSVFAASPLCAPMMKSMTVLSSQPQKNFSQNEGPQNFRYLEQAHLGTRVEDVTTVDGKSTLKWTTHFRHEQKEPVEFTVKLQGAFHGVSRVGLGRSMMKASLWAVSGGSSGSILEVFDLANGKPSSMDEYFSELIGHAGTHAEWGNSLRTLMGKVPVPVEETVNKLNNMVARLHQALAADGKARLIESEEYFDGFHFGNDQLLKRAILADGKLFTFDVGGDPENIFDLERRFETIDSLTWNGKYLNVISSEKDKPFQLIADTFYTNPAANSVYGGHAVPIHLPTGKVIGVDSFESDLYVLIESVTQNRAAPYKYKIFVVSVDSGKYQHVFNFQTTSPVTMFEKNLSHNYNFRNRLRDFSIWSGSGRVKEFLRFNLPESIASLMDRLLQP